MSVAHFDSLRSELVNAGGLAEEHQLQLSSIGVVIHKLSQLFIHRVVFDWNVDGHFSFEIDGVDLEGFNFLLHVPDLSQELQTVFICFIDTFFKDLLVVSCLRHMLLMLHPQLLQLRNLLSQKLLFIV